MKRILIGILTLMMVLSCLGCVRLPRIIELSNETVTFSAAPEKAEKEYDITVRDMVMMGATELTITPSDDPHVEVECSKALRDKYGLAVTFSGDTLTVATSAPHLSFRGGVLKLHIYANYDSIDLSGGYTMHVDGTGMREVDLSVKGAVNCTMKDLDADDVSVDLSGAGNISMSGAADSLEVDVSGAAKIDAEALTVREADVSISGAGSMVLTVTDALDAGISGTGSVRYYGDPQNVNARVSGAGSVKPAE